MNNFNSLLDNLFKLCIEKRDTDLKKIISSIFENGDYLSYDIEDELSELWGNINPNSIRNLFVKVNNAKLFSNQHSIDLCIKLYEKKILTLKYTVEILTRLTFEEIDKLPLQYSKLIKSALLAKEDNEEGFIKLEDDFFMKNSIKIFQKECEFANPNINT